MHGVQLWVALPDGARHEAPRAFMQYADLPRLSRQGLRATVILGELEGARSPATTYTPIMGAELSGRAATRRWDCGPTSSTACWRSTPGSSSTGHRLETSEIGYVGAGQERLELSSAGPEGCCCSGASRSRRRS